MSKGLCKKLFLGLAAAVAVVVVAGQGPWIGHAYAGEECDEEFEVDFFAEINATDGDAGVQLKLDGKGWNHLEIIDPDGFTILEISADDLGSLGLQGLTELFFESAEPSFDDQTLAEMLALFPEGDYEFEGVTKEGGTICGSAAFTHNLPAAPEPKVRVRDDDEVQISWKAVTGPFEDPSNPPADVGDDIEIEQYRVIVEALDEEGEGLQKLDVELPATSRRITIPEEFLALSPGGEFKYEVIATEESGNQTIFEGEFELGDDDDDDDEGRSRRTRR